MNNVCPLCLSSEYKIIGNPKINSLAKLIINQDYKVVQCCTCSAYFVNPKICFTDDEWEKLYNSEYFADQSNWLVRKRNQELIERFNKVEALMKNKDNVHFLDVGCGEGNSLIEGQRRGWSVMGIDITDNRSEEAKRNKIKFNKGHFLELELQENSFDFIYLDSVLEHVLTPIEYLIKIRTLLKVGGILYVGVPNEDSLFNFIREIVFLFIGRNKISTKIKPFDSPYHIIGFNGKSLYYTMEKVNLKIIEIRNFGRRMEFLSSAPTLKSFWINLFFLLPIEFIGQIIHKDIYYELYLSK